MSEYPIEECPVDGCKRGPFDTEGSLRGHVNASGDDGHDWTEVKQLVAGDGAAPPEGDDQSTTSGEQAKAGDSSTTDDQPTEGDDQAKAGNEQGNKQATEGDDQQMPTQDEYEDQHATSDGAGKAGDGSATDDQPDQGDTTSGSPLPSLPMDPKTLGMLLAVGLVLWLSYRALSGSSGSDQPITSDEQAKAGDGSTTDDQTVQGGLTG